MYNRKPKTTIKRAVQRKQRLLKKGKRRTPPWLARQLKGA